MLDIFFEDMVDLREKEVFNPSRYINSKMSTMFIFIEFNALSGMTWKEDTIYHKKAYRISIRIRRYRHQLQSPTQFCKEPR